MYQVGEIFRLCNLSAIFRVALHAFYSHPPGWLIRVKGGVAVKGELALNMVREGL